MTDPIARIVIHVDADERVAALRLARVFTEAAGLDPRAIHWSPYPKLGPHSRVAFIAAVPDCPAPADVAARLDAICGVLTDQPGYRGAWPTEDGGVHDERTFDTRLTPFRLPGVLWIDIEVDTYFSVQTDLRKQIES